jgi:hypothetical protein
MLVLNKTKAALLGRQCLTIKRAHITCQYAGGQSMSFAGIIAVFYLPLACLLCSCLSFFRKDSRGNCIGLAFGSVASGFLFSFVICQPFGSIPRDCSSFRRTRFIQVARDESPSFFISASSCVRNSCWRRIWYWSVFALLLDIVITKSISSVGGCNYNVTEIVLQPLNTAKPRSARTLTGRLTKPLIEVTVMADIQSTQTHPKFTWRFLALSASSSNVIHIIATTEREARAQSPVGYVMVFAGRLPFQEVSHV